MWRLLSCLLVFLLSSASVCSCLECVWAYAHACLSVCVPVCQHLCICYSHIDFPLHTSSSQQSFVNITDETLHQQAAPLCLSSGSTHSSIFCGVTSLLSPWWTWMHPDISTGLEQRCLWIQNRVGPLQWIVFVTSIYQISQVAAISSHYKCTCTMILWLQWRCEKRGAA